MKITTKTIYGIQFLLHLATPGLKELTQVKEIVKKEGLSEKYLELIAGQLRNANLLDVKRGAHGGYKLAKSPEDITILDIYKILESTDKQQAENTATLTNQSINKLIVEKTVRKIEDSFYNTLGSITLAQLVKEQESVSGFVNFQI